MRHSVTPIQEPFYIIHIHILWKAVYIFFLQYKQGDVFV